MRTIPKSIQLKITLIYSKLAIWRRIAVSQDYSFFDLHVAIQDAFGWYDQHLHQFFTDSPFKRNSQYERIALPLPDDDEIEDVIDERKIKVSKYLGKPGDTIFYEYDFGDSWMHEVKVEKVIKPESKTKYPQILGGANACPPEDCGGIGGYEYLLAVLGNPKDNEHQDMLDWLGLDDSADLKPDQFDPNSVKFRNPAKVLKEHEKGFGI
ncbi:MAG: plasmid pRiA4b ORF-3 family protein [Patescibacteria group bacterium]